MIRIVTVCVRRYYGGDWLAYSARNVRTRDGNTGTLRSATRRGSEVSALPTLTLAGVAYTRSFIQSKPLTRLKKKNKYPHFFFFQKMR